MKVLFGSFAARTVVFFEEWEYTHQLLITRIDKGGDMKPLRAEEARSHGMEDGRSIKLTLSGFELLTSVGVSSCSSPRSSSSSLTSSLNSESYPCQHTVYV